VFFQIVRPYLNRVEDYINKRAGSSRPNFGTYFDKPVYLSQYEEVSECHSQFARALVESQMFISFCDEAFSDIGWGGDGELTNYQMFQAIIKKRSEARDSEDEDEAARELTF